VFEPCVNRTVVKLEAPKVVPSADIEVEGPTDKDKEGDKIDTVE